jgi:predicted membrane chloride channel (bestrophin family)
MGIFQWLGSLLDQLISWLGRLVAAFLEALVLVIEALWYSVISVTLLAAFGAVTVLYAIFYATAVAGETLMEVWDPRYVDQKPSEVFKIKQAPQQSPLPTKRSEAKVLAAVREAIALCHQHESKGSRSPRPTASRKA